MFVCEVKWQPSGAYLPLVNLVTATNTEHAKINIFFMRLCFDADNIHSYITIVESLLPPLFGRFVLFRKAGNDVNSNSLPFYFLIDVSSV